MRALQRRADELRGRRGSPIDEAQDAADGADGADHAPDAEILGRRGDTAPAEGAADGVPEDAAARRTDADTDAGPTPTRLTEVPKTDDPEIDELAARNPEKVRQRLDALNRRKWVWRRKGNARLQNNKFVKDYVKKNKDNPKAEKPQRPHDENFPIYSVNHTVSRDQPLELVRVSDEEGSYVGGWLMLREDFDRIRKLPNAEEIFRTLFALKKTPKFFNRFTPPDGATFRMNYSVAGKNDWGPGGGVQFQLPERVPKRWFEREQHSIEEAVR